MNLEYEFKLQVNVQVNLCQKLLFLHQLTQNMTKDCSYSGLIDAKIRASDKNLPVICSTGNKEIAVEY